MRFPESLTGFPRSTFGAHLELARGIVADTGQVAREIRDPETRLKRLEADRDVRALVAAYMVAFDAKDVELLLSLYGPEPLLVNSFGTWRGLDAIRESHGFDLANNTYSFHNLANLIVRLSASGDEAWLGGYLYNVVEREGDVTGSVATCLFRLRATEAGWRVTECRTAPSGRHTLAPAAGTPTSGRPTPSDAETSNDLIGG